MTWSEKIVNLVGKNVDLVRDNYDLVREIVDLVKEIVDLVEEKAVTPSILRRQLKVDRHPKKGDTAVHRVIQFQVRATF